MPSIALASSSANPTAPHRGDWHAVLWDSSDKIQDLGVLPGGNYSVAFGVNDSEVVVGYGNLFDQRSACYRLDRRPGACRI